MHDRDSKRKRKRKGIENIFQEIITGNFPNLKDADFKIQEAQRPPNKLNPKRPIPRHITTKMAKDKDIRLSADFSTETLQDRREWQDIFKVLKGKNLQPIILYPARLSFKIEK